MHRIMYLVLAAMMLAASACGDESDTLTVYSGRSET